MVLSTCLVLVQRGTVLVITNQGVVVALASLNRIRDRWPTDDQALIQNAGQCFQLFQFANECGLVVLCDLGLEFEQHCRVSDCVSSPACAQG